jgi:hypothetical protein
MYEGKGVPVDSLKALTPAGWFEAVEKRPVSLVLEMYAEPRPTVELVLPAGYHGIVKVQMQIRDDAPPQPGQRLFSCVVSKSGEVQVVGPPVLRRAQPLDFRAKFADGMLVSFPPKETEVGLRWLHGSGSEQFFVVGTQVDYDNERRAYLDELRHTYPKADTGNGNSGQGKGGGRGRRNQTGN